MWLLDKHFRAFLLSATLIGILIRIRTSINGSGEKFVLTGNASDYEYQNITDEELKPEELPRRRKKYRDFILTERNVGEVNDSDVYILGLFDLSTMFGKRAEGLSEVAAAEEAIRHVNERGLLRGHQLKLLINDTQCDPGMGIDRFFHALYSRRTIVVLLGSGCSNVTESLASIVPYWNILQISYGSTSPTLSDRNKFPLFFRTVAPDSSLNEARTSFIQNFGWNRVATFSQRENEYLLPSNDLVVQLEKTNTSCVTSVTFASDNFKEQLQILKDSDVRVIVGSFSDDLARRIFCEVHRLGMFGADYVWILRFHRSEWWKSSPGCALSHLAVTTEGALFLSPHDVIPDDRKSISGLSNESFLASIRNSSSKLSENVGQVYDAIWTIGLVLELVQRHHELSEFYYDNDAFVEEASRELRKLHFVGVSGPVGFRGADRTGNSVFEQIQGGILKTIAVHRSENESLDFGCSHCVPIRWVGGRVPIAKRILRTKLIVVPTVAFFAVLVVSMLGIFTCLLFLYFNYRYRTSKAVKLSSPKLNSIATVGCILVYAAVVLLGVDTERSLAVGRFSQMCTVRVYLFSAGFSLAFGSMFAKTYRVHRIFTYRCASLVKDKILKDKQLITLVLALLVVDGIIATFWAYVDPLQRSLHNLTAEISSENVSVLYQPQVEICRCNNTAGWLLAMFGYKAFLLIMGLYMAWETRHIKVEVLNDSQSVGICVYSAVFTSIVVLLSNFLTDHTLLAYLARSCSILLSATLTLILLFVPKLKSVLCDVAHDPIMKSMGLKIECNTRRLLADDPRELTYRLQVQNKVYRCEIEALDKEIARLERLLQGETSRRTPRASWPSTQVHGTRIERGAFLSQNEISEGGGADFDERLKILDRLRKFFGRIPSVWLHFSSNAAMDANVVGEEEIVDVDHTRTRSMNVVYAAGEEVVDKPFFISVEEDKFCKSSAED